MKKIFSLFLMFIFVCTYSAPVSTSVFAADKSDLTVTGKAGILLKQELTKDELKELEDVDLDNGWELKGHTLSKFYPANENMISSEGLSDLLVNEDGDFVAFIKPNVTKKYSIGFERSRYKTVKNNLTLSSDKSIKVDLIYEVDFKTFIEIMEGDYSSTLDPNIEIMQPNSQEDDSVSFDLIEENEPVEGISVFSLPVQGGDTGGDIQIDEDGEKGRAGAYVHCNRFNGPHGNQTYYSSETKGALNFIESDCDYGFIRYNCTKDYTSSTNCKGLAYYGSTINSNIRNCSSVRSHSVRYHAH